MAWLQVDFFSACLMRTVPLNILIPADGPQADERPYQTLYLLHGFSGDCSDWLLNGRVAQLSSKYRLCIVIPSGENGFFVDQPGSGLRYSEYVGSELVEFTRKLLPLSHRREDTIIGGLSMGGFGSLIIGMKYAETFGHVIALSAGMVLDDAVKATDKKNAVGIDRTFFESLFGDLDKVMDSEMNPRYLARRAVEQGLEKTDLYIACGVNDRVVLTSREFVKYLDSVGYPYVYQEGPGTHEWAFWDEFLPRGLARIKELVPAPPVKNILWIDSQ